MKHIVGLKQFRENVQTYATRVGRGESFVVVRKSKPLFSLNPVDLQEQWETAVDFSKIRKSGVRIEDVLKKI